MDVCHLPQSVSYWRGSSSALTCKWVCDASACYVTDPVFLEDTRLSSQCINKGGGYVRHPHLSQLLVPQLMEEGSWHMLFLWEGCPSTWMCKAQSWSKLGPQHKNVDLLEHVQKRPRRCSRGWSTSVMQAGWESWFFLLMWHSKKMSLQFCRQAVSCFLVLAKEDVGLDSLLHRCLWQANWHVTEPEYIPP